MARNENSLSKSRGILARSRGTLRYVGPIPDYGYVTNDSTTPVQSNRTMIRGSMLSNPTPMNRAEAAPNTSTDNERPCGAVRSVPNMKP